jgi:hypothetical protein
MPDAVIEAMAREMWENSGRQMIADGLDPSLLQPWSEENEPHRENWRNNAKTALKAAEAAGYVLVPKEPTEAMQDAGNEEAESFIYSDEAGGKAWNDDGALNFWNAMIDARPKLS